MARRTRPRLSAAERGYGPPHRAIQAAAIAAFRPGQLCPRCKRPITSLWMTGRRGGLVLAVDMGHKDGTGKTQYSGLEHRHCNRSAGASLGNRMRGAVPPHWRPVRSPDADSACRYCDGPAVTGICPERICQLARVQAASLHHREGLTREQADEQMAARVRAALERRRQQSQDGHRR